MRSSTSVNPRRMIFFAGTAPAAGMVTCSNAKSPFNVWPATLKSTSSPVILRYGPATSVNISGGVVTSWPPIRALPTAVEPAMSFRSVAAVKPFSAEITGAVAPAPLSTILILPSAVRLATTGAAVGFTAAAAALMRAITSSSVSAPPRLTSNVPPPLRVMRIWESDAVSPLIPITPGIPAEKLLMVESMTRNSIDVFRATACTLVLIPAVVSAVFSPAASCASVVFAEWFGSGTRVVVPLSVKLNVTAAPAFHFPAVGSALTT